MKSFSLSKTFKYIFILSVLAISIFSYKSSFATVQKSGEEAIRSIESLSDSKNGIISCDPYSTVESERCHPKDAIILVKKIIEVCIYIAVIALVFMFIFGAVSYVYNGKSPEYLVKWKKYMKNSGVSILILMGIYIILGLLQGLQMDQAILNFLKQIFASNDFSLIQKASAQAIPKSSVGANGEYINFFPKQTVGSLILLSIKFLINYIAAPALVFATVLVGVSFVKAQGNAQKLAEAKKFAIRVVIGIVVAASAQIVVRTILNTLNEVTSTISPNTATYTTTTTVTTTPDLQEGGD